MGLPTPSLSFPLPAGLPRLPPLTILRITQCTLALLTLSLSSAVASHYNNQTGTISSPREINFLIFTSLFTLFLILPYTTLTPRFFPHLTNTYIMLSAEATSTLFYLAAFASTAHLITQQRASPALRTSSHATSAAIAATIFAAFLFITFTATTSFAIHHLFTSPPTPTPKYKRTHYHAHSRDLSSSLTPEKPHARAPSRSHFLPTLFTASRSDIPTPPTPNDNSPIAYPHPNLKILPRRGHDLEAANPSTPPRHHHHHQPSQSSWSPDSCAPTPWPASSPSSFRRTPRGAKTTGEESAELESRPYSTRLLVGRVRQGVGDMKARMPGGITYGWFGREREGERGNGRGRGSDGERW